MEKVLIPLQFLNAQCLMRKDGAAHFAAYMAACSRELLLCSGAALYEISLQRDLAMKEAEAMAQLQLIQETQRLEHQHAVETAQVWA